MHIFESYYNEIKQLLDYGDYQQLTKRIIDLTLDTAQVDQYRNTVQLLDRLDQIGDNAPVMHEALATRLQQLYTILKEKSANSISEPKSLLWVHNLTHIYPKSKFTLGPISLELKAGQILGLVGENGNGKTTLLRSLCGELKPTDGQIKFQFPYTDSYDLRSHLIYIPQRTDTWAGSLLSNLQFTASLYGTLGDENTLTVDLMIARMGLRKYKGYAWKNLSSGYKMRFELVRALLRKPKLLLIDEPLANLDILAQQIVLDDFRDMARSPFRPLGIILSSQQLYEVEKTSDNVIFLKQGAPQNMIKDNNDQTRELPKFIVEFESEWNQEQLRATLAHLPMQSLQINGGTYVAHFDVSVTQKVFMQTIIDNDVPIIYFRNITNSTRRFFLS